jgi:acyl-coenzyme A synthetase/AMP-(fatty) acid ligase
MLFALDGAGAAFARLRSVYTTSESLLRQDIDAWRSVLPSGCVVWIGYGLTEGAPLTGWFVSTDVPDAAARLPVGYPMPWHELAITDARGAPVPDGQAGELWARGRLLSLGEWRQGRCVPGRLLADPDDPLGAILRTGDLVRRRPDGLLEFLGRVDEQVRIRGNRVEPAELEHVLRETPGVADAAVLALRTPGDPLLVGFVVPVGVVPAARLREAVTARLHATLPPYLRPARLHVVSAVPRLPGGKIDPGALERLDDVSVGRGVAVARGPFARLRRRLGFGSG